jgi:PAS domain S-box-containing protein
MVDMRDTNEDFVSKNRDYEGDSLSLAMKDMQRSRDRLQRAQLLAGIGSFEYLPEDKLIVLSDEACACLGIEDGENVFEIEDFCKNIRQGHNNQFCDAIANISEGDDYDIQFIYRGSSKRDKHIEVIIDHPANTIEGSVSGVFRDITRMKEAEIAKNVNTQAFETIFSNAKIAIIVLNLKGYITDYNTSALNLFGYTSEEMTKMHSVNLLFEDDVLGASKMFAKFINSAGRINSVDYRVKGKNGEKIDVLVNFEMVIGHEGEKIFVFLNDLRGIREMERKHIDQERMLIQQSKMATLGEMVALIAHQWQQPLNSIAMIVQMLDELIEVDEKNRTMLIKSIDSVIAQVDFMSNTMNDFRNFLKPSNQKCDFNLDKVVQDVVKLYRPQLRHYGMNCEIFYDDEEIKKAEVHGYENELKNVILNFLTNSRDAIESRGISKGEVHIVLSEIDGVIRICIEDNGGGMPEEVMSRIFDPYVSTKGDKGTGLGLYMAKLIIKDRMHGDIHVRNTDRGACICIMLDRVN